MVKQYMYRFCDIILEEYEIFKRLNTTDIWTQ